MKILITGFEPFGGENVNPSYEAVKLLPDRMGQANIIKLQLPVSFEGAAKEVKSALLTHQPDAVLCVGQAGGYAGIGVERIAVNLMDASIPDNEGNQPTDQPIVPNGPAAYFSSLPVKDMVKTLKGEGIPAFVSNSAGTYVCNTVMYTLLHEIHCHCPNVRGGFIHVPSTPDQAAAKVPVPSSMALSLIAKGLEVAAGILAG